LANKYLKNAVQVVWKHAAEHSLPIEKGMGWVNMMGRLGNAEERGVEYARAWVIEKLGLTEQLLKKKTPTQQPKVAAPLTYEDANHKKFTRSYEWRALRMKVLDKYGARCMCCGATPEHGVKMHVDHIKPRRKYPELALSFDNLQILCEECNHGKGNWNETDWRPNYDASERVAAELMAHIRSL